MSKDTAKRRLGAPVAIEALQKVRDNIEKLLDYEKKVGIDPYSEYFNNFRDGAMSALKGSLRAIDEVLNPLVAEEAEEADEADKE